MKPSRALFAGVGAVALSLLSAGPALAQSTPTAPTPQQASAEERAAALVRPAVVYLQQNFVGQVVGSDGTAFSDGLVEVETTCTGFVVNPNGYIATAGHCVDEKAAGILMKQVVIENVLTQRPDLDPALVTEVVMQQWSVRGELPDTPVDREVTAIIGTGTGNNLDGEALPAQVVDYKPIDQGDVALLKVQATDLPSIELAPDASVQTGAKVLSVGYPGSTAEVTDASLEPSFKDGQVSNKTTSGSVPVYEISAAVTNGMSGGPTITLDGKVVGINSFSPRGEEQAFNFLTPAGTLNEMLGRNNVRAELGPNDRLYRDALGDFFGGYYTDAIAKFDQLLMVSPEHAQAQEFKTRAVKSRAQFGDTVREDTSGIGVAPFLVGGGAVLVLVIGLGTFLLLRRGHRGSGYPAVPAQPVAFPAATPQAMPQPMSQPMYQPMYQPMSQPMPQAPHSPPAGFPAPVPATVAQPTGEQHLHAVQHQHAVQLATPPTGEVRSCPGCSTPQEPDAVFCTNCGTRLR